MGNDVALWIHERETTTIRAGREAAWPVDVDYAPDSIHETEAGYGVRSQRPAAEGLHAGIIRRPARLGPDRYARWLW